MTEEEKKAIEYLTARLYGNEGCKFIDVAQSDLRIFLNLVERQEKDIENWKKYCNEQDEDIIAKNNKICDLEFKVDKQDTEINKLNNVIDRMAEVLNDFDYDKQCENCRTDICSASVDGTEYTHCIKEYFMKEDK